MAINAWVWNPTNDIVADHFIDNGAGAAIASVVGVTVTQYQPFTVNVSGWSDTVISGTLGSDPVAVIEGDASDDLVTLRGPGTPSSGPLTLTLVGDVSESAFLTGVAYTATHPYLSPYVADADDNSLFYQQKFPNGTYHKVISPGSAVIWDPDAVEAAGAWKNNVNTYMTAVAGFNGIDAVTLQFLYPDGSTADWSIFVEVDNGIIYVGGLSTRNLWVAAQLGHGGNVRDLWIEFFTLQGIPPSDYNNMAMQWLQSLGYTGNLADRWAKFEEDLGIGR